MTRKEHLLTILSEECAEVAHRVSKILRFGQNECQPGQDEDNQERLEKELCDLLAVVEMLEGINVLRNPVELLDMNARVQVEAKKEKVEHFLEYSRQRGTLV